MPDLVKIPMASAEYLARFDGIFLRLSSLFEGQPPLPDILTKVRSDEEMVFGILGIEEATNA
jgi:hypothetical protein